MATAYYRDQAGAPALVYANGNAAGFLALKTILTACLVTGYGSVPAAGWELINDGSDFIVFRNGVHSGYLCLSLAGGAARVYVGATYTGMSGNVMQGDGVKSGSSASPTTFHQVHGGATVAATSAATSWMMVADERTFMLCVHGGAANTDLGTKENDSATLLYAGEDSAGTFIALGGAQGASSDARPRFSFSHGFTALTDPTTGLLVDIGSISAIGTMPEADNNTIRSWTQLVPDVALTPIDWWVTSGVGGYAGRLRGVVIAAAFYQTRRGGMAAALGFPGAFTTRLACTPIDLGDAFDWFIPAGYDPQCPPILMTTHEDYW